MNKISTEHREFFGMPLNLCLGYIALIFFMTGDGVEQAFLSRYLVDCGFSVAAAATVFSVYGIAVATSAWLSGTLSEIFGPKRVMRVGFILWVSLHIVFLVAGLGRLDYVMILITYGLRGFAFPLFSYSFLVWIAYATPISRLSSAYGWFWFCFAGGLGATGSYVASFLIPILDFMGTLWCSLIFIFIGGVLGAFLLHERHGKNVHIDEPEAQQRGKLGEFVKGISILWENPRVLAGGIVRVINTTSQYGFVVALPLFFTDVIGLTTAQWLLIWGGQNLIHIVWILVFGFVGNRFRWHKVIQWWGCVFTGCACLAIYYVSGYLGANTILQICLMSLYALGLAAFVPLSAIMPSLEPSRKGTSAGILNLAAGLSTVTGPAIVGLLYPSFGLKGVVWAFAALYLIGAILCQFLNVHEKENPELNGKAKDEAKAETI